MWALINQTRFKAERAFARDSDGAEIWIVAVRASFSIRQDGTVVVAEKQQEVCRVPEFSGDPVSTSLRYDSDLVRTKSGTDIVLHAYAHAPGAYPANFVDVGFSVGPLSKQLRVFGDRSWFWNGSDFEPGAPQPFMELPVCYERAWGGLMADGLQRYPENPAGAGLNPGAGDRVANVESPFQPIQSFRAGAQPAGFGPIACQWQPRLQLAGTYDEHWQQNRRPLTPGDFQDAYFRCAPCDQQLAGFLQGGEDVVLLNLTPEGLLHFQLPRISIGFATQIGGETTNHRGQLHTVIIEPEERRLSMVWQTSLPCHQTLYTLKRTTVFEKNR